MDGLPARTGVRLPSKQCQRWAPTQNCKNMYSAVGSVSRKGGWGEGPLSAIAPPAGHDEDDAPTLPRRDKSGARTHHLTHSVSHTLMPLLSTLVPTGTTNQPVTEPTSL